MNRKQLAVNMGIPMPIFMFTSPEGEGYNAFKDSGLWEDNLPTGTYQAAHFLGDILGLVFLISMM